MERVRERRYLLEGGWRVPLEGERKGVNETGDTVAPAQNLTGDEGLVTPGIGKRKLQGA